MCLDASTLSLFGSSFEDRILYAGSDIFSFTLLHWVAGITFMLLVTVSVLQLREVAHPGLLAQVIRPQEPQPDLLGNLLHESVTTHGKRMVLSLVIYAALLTVHVYLPIRFLIRTGVANWLPISQMKISYFIIPQLQIPLELLFFHICMLGMLEKNKNSIGEIQHYWLKFLCRQLGFVNSVLPRFVEKFRLVGSRRIYLENSTNDIDPFWYDLALAEKKPRDELIRANLGTFHEFSFDPEGTTFPAATKDNGERSLPSGMDYTRLPVPVRSPGPTIKSRSLLLPTKMGRYRIKRDISLEGDCPVFQLWEEVAGDPIPRPPEGWDDLGVGGADVQGRWAWGRERKSTIERGIAFRDAFFYEDASSFRKFVVLMKLAILMALSWATTTICLFSLVLGPLAIGRFFFYILRVEDTWIHDPFGFAIGSIFFFPPIRLILTFCTRQSLPEMFGMWVNRFYPPPLPKLAVLLVTTVLCCGVSPFVLGWILDIGLVKSASWFAGEEESWIDARSNVLNWVLGLVVLAIWLRLCVIGVLTRRFWEDVYAGDGGNNAAAGARRNAPRGGGGAAAAAAAAERAGGDPAAGPHHQSRWRAGTTVPWQGPRGRAATFVDAWKAAILRCEWDKVDYRVMVSDVALPLAIELSLTLLFAVSAIWFEHGLLGSCRAARVRGLLLIVVALQVARSWPDQVLSSCEAAHRSARDHMYLIGEVLMNYNEQ